MFITSSIFIFLTFLGSLFLLIFTLVYVYYLYRKEREFEDKKIQIYKQSQEILEQSYRQAKDIIEKATEKARETLSSSLNLKGDIEKDLHNNIKMLLDKNIKEIEAISNNYKNSYDSLLEGIKGEYLKKTKENLEEMKNKQTGELDSFTQTVTKQTIDAEKNIETKTNQELQKVRSELEVYKKEEIEKINKATGKIIIKILGQILPRVINSEDQEKLIIQAIEQAKKDGVFS